MALTAWSWQPSLSPSPLRPAQLTCVLYCTVLYCTVLYCTVLTSRGLRSSSRPALASPRPTRRQSSTARGQLQG